MDVLCHQPCNLQESGYCICLFLSLLQNLPYSIKSERNRVSKIVKLPCCLVEKIYSVGLAAVNSKICSQTVWFLESPWFFSVYVQWGERCGKEKFRVTTARVDIKQDVSNSAAHGIIWFSVQGFQKMFLQYREMDLLIAHENFCVAKSVATSMFVKVSVADRDIIE